MRDMQIDVIWGSLGSALVYRSAKDKNTKKIRPDRPIRYIDLSIELWLAARLLLIRA